MGDEVVALIDGRRNPKRYTYEITPTPKAGGDAIVDTGHGIHVFQRQTDGSWNSAKDIWTSVPMPEEAM